jgi:hypothetical protein
MGFHKRFITKDIILLTEEEHLDTLFSSDALIFEDDWSMEFYNMYYDGVTIKEIKEKLSDERTS